MEKQVVTNGISRRSFLKRGGGITFMIAAIGIPGVMVATKNGSIQLTAWVHLDADGTLTIYNPAAEMGQGTMTNTTSLPSARPQYDRHGPAALLLARR
jgi:isoquinoline 1-oxidoreductase subunit beta